MWKLNKPEPVKLIFGILACDAEAMAMAIEAIEARFGKCDMKSRIWPFTHTKYYEKEAGANIIKQFTAVERLISPDKLAGIKHKTNKIEARLAVKINRGLNRPVNIDPGYIEPSKLVLASTKNFSHRIYIGKKMWAEVTLCYNKGTWKWFDYTFPDHREDRYHGFFSKVRQRLNEQLRGA